MIRGLVLAVLLALPNASFAETLRIGTESDFVPYIFMDEIGERAGFDPEVMDAICESCGYDCVWVEVLFDALFTRLAAVDYDIAVGGNGETPSRAKFANWTKPYRHLESGFSSLVGLSDNIDPQSARIGVQIATKQHDILKMNAVPFVSNSGAAAALKAGEIDVFFAGAAYVANLVETDPSMRILGQIEVTDRGIQIAVSKSRPNLQRRLNGLIDELIDHGTIALSTARWFPTIRQDDSQKTKPL